MGYAIFRIAPRKSKASCMKMVKHALREDEVPNAVEGASKPELSPPGYGYRTSQEALAALNAKIEAAKNVRAGWQKSSTAALDILVTASREDMLSWDLPRQREFFSKALRFIEKRFGGKQNILAAAIHRDEATPHMQVVLAPVNAEGRFSASKMVGGRDQLSQLQTAFHAVCGEPFGLERGIQRTNAKHVPVRAFYGAMNAGMELPEYVQVPPSPTAVDNLKGTYKAKQAAHEAALAKNAAIREEVHKQARQGRMVHPSIVKKQAEQYRETKRLADLAALQRAEAQALKESASERMVHASNMETRARDTLETTDRQAGAKLIDRFSKHMDPAYVATLSKAIGIELQAGKGLCDQIRRAGLANNLLAAAELLDKAGEGSLLPAAQGWQQRQDDQNTPSIPRP